MAVALVSLALALTLETAVLRMGIAGVEMSTVAAVVSLITEHATLLPLDVETRRVFSRFVAGFTDTELVASD